MMPEQSPVAWVACKIADTGFSQPWRHLQISCLERARFLVSSQRLLAGPARGGGGALRGLHKDTDPIMAVLLSGPHHPQKVPSPSAFAPWGRFQHGLWPGHKHAIHNTNTFTKE